MPFMLFPQSNRNNVSSITFVETLDTLMMLRCVKCCFLFLFITVSAISSAAALTEASWGVDSTVTFEHNRSPYCTASGYKTKRMTAEGALVTSDTPTLTQFAFQQVRQMYHRCHCEQLYGWLLFTDDNCSEVHLVTGMTIVLIGKQMGNDYKVLVYSTSCGVFFTMRGAYCTQPVWS